MQQLQLSLERWKPAEDDLGVMVLAEILKRWPRELVSCMEQPNYKRVAIPKDSTGENMRILNIPQGEQAEVIRLARRRLVRYLPPSYDCHSRKRGSPITNASVHRQSRSFFCIDFKDAYMNVSQETLAAGIMDALRLMFFRMPIPYYFPSYWEECMQPRTSRSGTRDWHPLRKYQREDRAAWANAIAAFALTPHDGLPQGSPISPQLLNIACLPLDIELSDLACIYGLDWGRYSDNITLSSREGSIPAEARSEAIECCKRWGFPINRQKTGYHTGRGRRPVITGITLTERKNYKRKLVLARKQIRHYRGLIYRAATDTSIPVEKVKGIMCWVSSVYGKQIPNQLKKPLREFMESRGVPKLAVGYELTAEML